MANRGPGMGEMTAGQVVVTVHYPLELHYIKSLFLHKQYRQCIQVCRSFLSDPGHQSNEGPLQKTFATFYLGLSRDELARLMHDYSQAKIPAFDQAQLFYHESLHSLCTAGSTIHTVGELHHDGTDPFIDGANDTAPTWNTQGFNQRPQPFRSPPMSPPSYIRSDSLPISSPPQSSHEISASDLSKLKSHESLDDIITPHKVLQRDISLMSLLDEMSKAEPPRSTAPRRLPSSMSQGLLRPIRPGSPPKQYHVPPRLPFTASTPSRSRLPKLVASSSRCTPTRARIPNAVAEEEVTTSPVSPLASENAVSEISAISPVSPATPTHATELNSPSPFGGNDYPTYHNRVEEQLEAVRAQLESHVAMVDKAKQQTIQAQAERAASRTAVPSSGTSSMIGANSYAMYRACTVKRMSQSRSYWSFTPESLKVNERQKRVIAGRERGWERERFQPEKYMKLAENALAEL